MPRGKVVVWSTGTCLAGRAAKPQEVASRVDGELSPDFTVLAYESVEDLRQQAEQRSKSARTMEEMRTAAALLAELAFLTS